MEAVVHEKKDSKEHVVTITVNEKPVEIQGPKATGLEIKQAAIAQGLKIEISFVLSEELPNRRTRIVGDTDVVTVTKHSRFSAVAPDDNS
jgi:hypothetical protein